MSGQINTMMQVCFFAIAQGAPGMLTREKAIAAIKKTIRKTYGKKGDDIVQMNLAVDNALGHLDKPAQRLGEIVPA